ncbi:MAG: ATP-grasp domain-containing protein [Clostridia bacterium]|nr:ATP-grasp domain-containing protein [Clostridia bacterium]
MKNVAVIFGGISVEHDVSVITGVLTLNCFKNIGYNPIPIYIDTEGVFYTGEILKDIENYKTLNKKKLKRVTFFNGDNNLYQIKGKKHKSLGAISVAINCTHGEYGEDGSIFGLLKLSKIPLASPSLLGASVSMDKYATKLFLKGIGVKYLPCVNYKTQQDLLVAEKKLGFPVMVKPARLGSSIGIKKASNKDELLESVNYALKFDSKVLIEKCLENFKEINCAVYKNSKNEIICSPLEQPFFKGEILSFDDKYSSGEREFPANLEKGITQKIKNISKKVYEELGFTGIIRIDFMVKENNVYLNEINSVPGSLSYYLFSETFNDFSKILKENVLLAEKNFAIEQSLTKKITTSVLQLKGIKGGKGGKK